VRSSKEWTPRTPDLEEAVEEFLASYIETALWSSMDESNPEGGDPMDANYGSEDIHPDTLKEMEKDSRDFLQTNWRDIDGKFSLAGHDFWLTRNHHGAGFWDGDWPKEIGRRLTEASHPYGGFNLEIGDDNLVHGR
jgi:hypothetical protein